MKIEVRADVGPAQRALAALRAKAADLAPAFREIGSGIVEEARLGFRESKDPYGTPWQKLKASTIARRRKGSSQPLLDTGRLRNSISFRLIGNGVEVGTNVRYAAIHQFGGEAGRGRKVEIPARPYLPLTTDGDLQPEAREEVLDTILRHLKRAAGV